jgi:hypothetical protein
MQPLAFASLGRSRRGAGKTWMGRGAGVDTLNVD